jgi:tRNA A37 N6-isopentenylltransferase MiaA
MPARGFSIDVPTWWMDDLATAVRQMRLTHTDLAQLLLPKKPALHGDHLKRAISAARVKVNRFFEDDIKKRVRTIEVIRAWTTALELLPFEFRAVTRDQARAFVAAAHDPAQILRSAQAKQLEAMLESGEMRLDDLLAGRQAADVPSAHGDVRRRPRGADATPANPRGVRG